MSVLEGLIIKMTFFIRHKGRKMFYLTTHSTHFIYGYMAFITPVVDHWLEREIAQW